MVHLAPEYMIIVISGSGDGGGVNFGCCNAGNIFGGIGSVKW